MYDGDDVEVEKDKNDTPSSSRSRTPSSDRPPSKSPSPERKRLTKRSSSVYSDTFINSDSELTKQKERRAPVQQKSFGTGEGNHLNKVLMKIIIT